MNQYRRACEAPLVECPYFRRFLTVDGQTGSNPSWTKAGFTNGWKGLIGETTRAADSICQQCVSSDTYIRPSPFSILQIAGQGAGRASRALPRYRLPGRCAAVLPAAREESQGLSRADFPDQDFGEVRELHCNKQSVSQPEFSLTTKLRHSRQNDT